MLPGRRPPVGDPVMPDTDDDEFGLDPEPTPQDEDQAAMAAEDRYLEWLWGRDTPDP